MKKDEVEITIEETICQTFVIKRKDIEIIEEMYKNSELVIDNGEVQSVSYTYDDVNWISIQ